MRSPKETARQITLTQAKFFALAAAFLFYFPNFRYVLLGWGVVLISTSAMYYIALRQPGYNVKGILLGEIAKYLVFISLIMGVLSWAPASWYYVVIGIVAGKASHLIASVLLEPDYAS